jgi:hypothetical protein
MALGWFQRLAGNRAVGWSGGSEPGVEINRAAIEAMAEVGIDITGEFPKPWTDEIVQAADGGDAAPLFPGKRTRTGFSTILPDRTSSTSDPSATRSRFASELCLTLWESRSSSAQRRPTGRSVPPTQTGSPVEA